MTPYVVANLHLNSIAFKNTVSAGSANWNAINKDMKEGKDYNNKLYGDTLGADYTDFMKAVNPAAVVAATNKKYARTKIGSNLEEKC